MTKQEKQTRLVEIDRFNRVPEDRILDKVEPFIKLGYSFKAEPNSYYHESIGWDDEIKTNYKVIIYRKEYVDLEEVDAE